MEKENISHIKNKKTTEATAHKVKEWMERLCRTQELRKCVKAVKRKRAEEICTKHPTIKLINLSQRRKKLKRR